MALRTVAFEYDSNLTIRWCPLEIQSAILLGSFLLFGGCGDGIGRPIRADISGTGGASGAGTGTPSAIASGGSGLVGGVTVGAMAYCSATQNWPVEQATAEGNLLSVLNLLRQSGQVTCAVGSSGLVGPPLLMTDQLRCSARLHSQVMLQSGLLTSLAGEAAATRIALSGYSANQFAEIITTSAPTNVDVAALLDRLVTGAGTDCANLLDPSFTSVGIGFAANPVQGYWTIDLASP